MKFLNHFTELHFVFDTIFTICSKEKKPEQKFFLLVEVHITLEECWKVFWLKHHQNNKNRKEFNFPKNSLIANDSFQTNRQHWLK